MTVEVDFLVEGILDEELVRRVLLDFELRVGLVLRGGGKSFVDRHVHGFCCEVSTARRIALRDLDQDAGCAPRLTRKLLGTKRVASSSLLGIPVRSVESWMMSDREPFARFIGVQPHRIPKRPERLANPKDTVLRLAKGSGNPQIREGMVVDERGQLVEGPLYNSMMADFVRKRWEPARAAKRSASLARILGRISAW